ncbi:SCO0607 family lipoprotein [Actinoplanes sp. NPDC049118]|uniref:SCO0607 family lipoprotein n=1 Tax=Actinoplanes sp. NPDC049118 TaxID=3155769 RepID=UPI0033FE1FEA
MRSTSRTRKLTITLLGTTALAATLLAAGCSWNEAICRGDEYPVAAVGSTGRDCVPEDQEPPAGYVRFPDGKVPKHVGDEWDEYWKTHVIDETGAIVEV